MKKLLLVLACISVAASIICQPVFADSDAQSWYCHRNGNKQPPISEEEELIFRYSGYCVDRSVNDESARRVIYLTFDLGYDNGNAEKIIDYLNSEKIPAAFFILGNIVKKNADLIEKMQSGGHLICSHTLNHKNLSKMTAEGVNKELTALESLYESKTGHSIDKFFRFPEGRYSIDSLAAVEKMGYKTVFWSFAYDDWDNSRQMRPELAIEKILSNTHNGAVMLFHPTSATNAEIMPRLVEQWRNAGYTFGTLEQLTK